MKSFSFGCLTLSFPLPSPSSLILGKYNVGSVGSHTGFCLAQCEFTHFTKWLVRMAPIEDSMSTVGSSAGTPNRQKSSRRAGGAAAVPGSPATTKSASGVFGRGNTAPKFGVGKGRPIGLMERQEKPKELLDAILARSQILGKPDKCWAAVGAKLNISHAFGSSAAISDPVISYAGPPSANSDLDYSDRIVYSVGAQIVLSSVEDGSKYFVSGRPNNVVGILHIAMDASMQLVSVCENTCGAGEEEGETPLKSQLSVYSVASKERDCLATFCHPNSSQFTASVFARGMGASSKQVVALCGNPNPEIVLWDWETKKTLKVVSLSSPVTRIRCAPVGQFMLTTSGEQGLKCWYHQSDTLNSLAMIQPTKETGPDTSIVEHVWMPSGNGINKLCALSAVLEPGDSKRTNFRRQQVYILEGRDQADAGKVDKKGGGKGAPTGPSGPAFHMELRQTVVLKLKDHEDLQFTAMASSLKGFVLVGNYGHVSFFERTDDKREPYIEVRHLILGEEFPLVGVCVLPSEHNVVVMSDSGRLLSMPVEMTIEVASADKLPSGKDDSSMTSLTEKERLVGYGAADVTHGGVHLGSITCACMATERSILVTLCVEDNTCRVWNYETRKCEVVHHFGSDEPISIAVHPNGLFMVVSFKDRVRGYNIAMSSLKPYKEVIQKGCKEIAFSRGGMYIACASGINLVVFETTTFKQVMNFQGHMMPIKRIAWAPGDMVIFSASIDGTIFGWPVSRDGRIDVMPSNPRASAILGLEVDCSSMTFLPPLPDNGEDGAPATRIEEERFLILSTVNGMMNLPAWAYNSPTWENVKNANMQIWGEEASAISCLKLSSNRRHLYAGTKQGTVRVYAWPPVNDNKIGLYLEIQAHSSPVISVSESPRGDMLISAGEDGAIFCYTLTKAPWTSRTIAELKSGVSEKDAPVSASLELLEGVKVEDLEEDPFVYNNQILLLGSDEMEEHVEEVAMLHKKLHDLETSSAYRISQIETLSQETQRKMAKDFDLTLNEERDRYEQLRGEFDEKVRSLLTTIESKEADSLKVVSDLENRYEHKLSDQLDRYDKLAEEMELLRQKCEGLLLADRNDFTKQLNDTVNNARLREKKMRAENKRITDDRASDESAFKEILDQQEHEYEDELRQLIAAAEGELIVERDNIGKLRTLVQTKNTKLDQLKKKLIELSMASKARASLLNNEKNEKMKLLETIEHYKKNLKEREEVVAEKEKIIMELRSKTRTLENFRFVLDHRLQQLSAERGPIASHIEGLERHISSMYEELVQEFENKKEGEVLKEKSEQQTKIVVDDLNRARVAVRKSENYISGFKRELGNIVSAMVIGKELEESVRLLYRKYVKGEVIGETTVKTSADAQNTAQALIQQSSTDLQAIPDGGHGRGQGNVSSSKGRAFALEVEETLIESAKEAERQKISKGKEAAQLKHRLEATKLESLNISRKRLGENSSLLFEVNDLRKDVRKGLHTIFERDETIKELEHQLREMKKRSAALASGGAATLSLAPSASKPKAGGANASMSVLSRSDTPNIIDVFGAPPSAARPPRSQSEQRVPTALSTAEEESSSAYNAEDTGAPSISFGDDQILASESYSADNTQEFEVPRVRRVEVGKARPGSGTPVAATPTAVTTAALQQRALQPSHSESALRRAVGVGIDARSSNPNKWMVHNALPKAKSDADLLNANKADVELDATGQAWQPRTEHNMQPTLMPPVSNPVKAVDDHPARKSKPKRTDAVAARVQTNVVEERDLLMEQLDESWRIRENQRVEIAQLRKLLMRANGLGFAGDSPPYAKSGATGPAYSNVEGLDDIQLSEEFQASVGIGNDGAGWAQGSLVLNNEPLRVTPGLTHADRTGVPSAGDLKDMRLGAVSGGQDGAAYPNKSDRRVAKMKGDQHAVKVGKASGGSRGLQKSADGKKKPISLPNINSNNNANNNVLDGISGTNGEDEDGAVNDEDDEE
jgi:WD40 repeat protein